MKSAGFRSIVLVAVGFLLAGLAPGFPSMAHAAWVNNAGTQFQVGGALTPTIVPALPTPAGTFVDPTCGVQGGTSLALVQGLKVAGVDPIRNPLVLVVSCLDNGGTTTIRARLNFIGVDGKVVKQLPTSAVPSTGWAHLVNRPDKGDLLGCGANGALYKIDYANPTGNPPAAPATQLALASPVAQQLTSCQGLAWDAEADMIYVGLSVNGGNKIGRVVRFQESSAALDRNFTSLPCLANGLAISGGVLLMSCVPQNNPQPTDATMFRLDKSSGSVLGVFGKGTTADPSFHPPAGLGDLACDPVTFSKSQIGATGATTNTTGYGINTTTVTLASAGTGAVRVGDIITFGSDTQTYVVTSGDTDVSNGGTLSFTPGLKKAIPATATAITLTAKDLFTDGLWSRTGVNGNGVVALEFPAFTCGLPSNSVVIQNNGMSYSPLSAGLSDRKSVV